jgi:hypothetical protein
VGGAGNDSLNSKGGGKDIVRCGPGKDRVVADKQDQLLGGERVRH